MRVGTDCAPKGGIPAVSKGNSISSAQTNDLETEHRIEQRQNGDVCSSDCRGFHLVSPVETAQRTATRKQQRLSNVLKSSRPAADSELVTGAGPAIPQRTIKRKPTKRLGVAIRLHRPQRVVSRAFISRPGSHLKQPPSLFVLGLGYLVTRKDCPKPTVQASLHHTVIQA
jgi:hypothetical protein